MGGRMISCWWTATWSPLLPIQVQSTDEFTIPHTHVLPRIEAEGEAVPSMGGESKVPLLNRWHKEWGSKQRSSPILCWEGSALYTGNIIRKILKGGYVLTWHSCPVTAPEWEVSRRPAQFEFKLAKPIKGEGLRYNVCSRTFCWCDNSNQPRCVREIQGAVLTAVHSSDLWFVVNVKTKWQLREVDSDISADSWSCMSRLKKNCPCWKHQREAILPWWSHPPTATKNTPHTHFLETSMILVHSNESLLYDLDGKWDSSNFQHPGS